MSASAILSAPNAPAATGLAISDDRTAAGGVFADLLATETAAAAVVAAVVAPVARTPSLSTLTDAPIDSDAEAESTEAGLDLVGAAALGIATPTVIAPPSVATSPTPDRLSAGRAPAEASTGPVVADEAAVPTEAAAVPAAAPVGSGSTSPTANERAPTAVVSAPSRVSEAPIGQPVAAKAADPAPALNEPAATTQASVDAAVPASVAAPREPQRTAQSGIDLIRAALASGGPPSAPARVTGLRSPTVADLTAASAEVAEAPTESDPIAETRATRPPVVAATPAISMAIPPVASRTAASGPGGPNATAPSSPENIATGAAGTQPGPEATPTMATPSAPAAEARAPGGGTALPTLVVISPAKTDQATNASAERSAPDRSQGDAATASNTGSPSTAQPTLATVPATNGFEASPAAATAAAPVPAAPEGSAAQAVTVSPSDTAAPTPPAAETSLSSLSRGTIEATAQLAAQITRRLEGRSTRFEMALTPDGLGRVDVSLDIDADGQLAARLAFDNPLAATDLRGRADELRRQLEDAGFTLTRDALEFSGRDGSSGGGQAFDRRQGRAAAYATRNAAAEAEALAPTPWTHPQQTPRGVDVKV